MRGRERKREWKEGEMEGRKNRRKEGRKEGRRMVYFGWGFLGVDIGWGLVWER